MYSVSLPKLADFEQQIGLFGQQWMKIGWFEQQWLLANLRRKINVLKICKERNIIKLMKLVRKIIICKGEYTRLDWIRIKHGRADYFLHFISHQIFLSCLVERKTLILIRSTTFCPSPVWTCVSTLSFCKLGKLENHFSTLL